MPPKDPDRIRLIHKLDQLTGVLSDLAPMMASYYCDLRAEGFNESEAIELVKAIQQGLLRDAQN